MLLEGERVGGLISRGDAICLDPAGRVCLLYSRLADPAGSGMPSHRVVALGRETDIGFREQVIEDGGPDRHQLQDSHCRSLILLREPTRLLAAFRRPADETGNAGQSVLLRYPIAEDDQQAGAPHQPEASARATTFRNVHEPEASARDTPSQASSLALRASVPHAQALLEPDNWGFDARLLSRGVLPAGLRHFGHDRRWLRATFQEDGEWHTRMVGRQGDGLRNVAVADSDGHWHTVFRPHRFGTDASALTYLRINSSTWQEEEAVREVVDPMIDASDPAIALAPDGSVVVLFIRSHAEIPVARRTNAGWTLHSVLREPDVLAIGNLTCGRDGNCYFAYLSQSDRGVWLARGSGDSWTVESVGQYPPSDDSLSGYAPYTVVTQIDLRSEPVVLVAHRSEQEGWLRVYRPAEPI